jgi:hypothetical protein
MARTMMIGLNATTIRTALRVALAQTRATQEERAALAKGSAMAGRP